MNDIPPQLRNGYRALARSDLWHVVVFAQATEVLVQLLDLLLVRLDTLLPHLLFQSLPSHLVVPLLSLRLLSAAALSYRSFGGIG